MGQVLLHTASPPYLRPGMICKRRFIIAEDCFSMPCHANDIISRAITSVYGGTVVWYFFLFKLIIGIWARTAIFLVQQLTIFEYIIMTLVISYLSRSSLGTCEPWPVFSIKRLLTE